MTTDCRHQRLMQIAGVPYCHDCKEYLTTGICPKCNRAIDDHAGIGTPELACPKDDGLPT